MEAVDPESPFQDEFFDCVKCSLVLQLYPWFWCFCFFFNESIFGVVRCCYLLNFDLAWFSGVKTTLKLSNNLNSVFRQFCITPFRTNMELLSN